jgi:hypothetical protein
VAGESNSSYFNLKFVEKINMPIILESDNSETVAAFRRFEANRTFLEADNR